MEQRAFLLKAQFKEELQLVHTSQDLEALRVKFLGKKGLLQELVGFLKTATPEERPRLGQLINALKNDLTALCDEAFHTLSRVERLKQLDGEAIDVTLPGKRPFQGRKHPVRLLFDEVLDILVSMGFSIQEGPDVDSDYYNFEGLNYPKDHPAREMQDTFYISPEMLLRSHTSNVQLRVMETHAPPIRIVAPGTVYRNETISARSHVFFHQVEMLYVDKGVSFVDLFSTIDSFLKRLFGDSVKTRFRPSFFPFVEPGLEVDIGCTACASAGCSLCKYSGWLEILGAGMVHPEVLRNAGIDPEVYSGYAWGLGVERLALLRYGVKDIRFFTENDMRLLSQF